jgi:hypothetical protein
MDIKKYINNITPIIIDIKQKRKLTRKRKSKKLQDWVGDLNVQRCKMYI